MTDLQPGSTALYVAGGEFRSSRDVLLFDTFAMRHDVHTESVWTACFHPTAPSGPAPYGPGCPTTSGAQNAVSPFIISDERLDADQVRGIWGGGRLPAGSYGVGGNLTSVTPAEDAGYEQLWVVL